MNEINELLNNPTNVLLVGLMILVSGKYLYELWKFYRDRFNDKHEELKAHEEFAAKVEALDAMSQQHTAMLEAFKKLINNLNTQISEIYAKLKDIQEDMGQDRAVSARIRLLRMNDEIIAGMTHSEETYDQALEDIDRYECYCMDHPNFKNKKATIAISNIEESYKEKYFRVQ